ncbi:MAG: hypothetical protein QOE23_79, partial [Pseudonocardiales bacterium]|nr:hypothetical protein [Pseudonocardiales bacterium]
MDIQQLYTALQPFQDVNAGTLTIAASEVPDWPDVRDLLVAALAGQRLSITGIPNFPLPPTSNAITYQGVSGLFPWDRDPSAQTVLSVTATFSVDQTGQPQLLVRGAVPSGGAWRLPNSLAGLADTELATVEFDAALFGLTSSTATINGFTRPVEPFVALSASVVTTGPFAPGQPLLLTVASRQVEGPVVLSTGSMPELTLDPVGAAPVSLPGVAAEFAFGATVYSYYRTLPYHDPLEPIIADQTLPFATAALQASLLLGPGPALVLSMPVLPASDFYELSVTASRPLASWGELDALVGSGVDLAAAIPADVPPAAALILRGLSLSLYYPSTATLPTVSSLTFDVFLQTGDWELLPNNILTLQGVGAGLSVLFEGELPQVSGLLYSDFTIVEEVPMRATLSIPRLVFTASLPPDVTVSVESLMGSVLEKLTGRRYAPPIAMDISRLEMSVDIPNRTFGFGTDILTDWTIRFGEANGGTLITLGFQGISFEVDYNGQELQAGLTALTSINEGRFFFSAVSPGNGVGWAFAGGLLTGSTLSITQLLLNFMYPGGNVPGGAYGIPDLVIDRLIATLATDAENNPSEYTFEGGLTTSWQFTVLPGSPTLQLSAQVSLHGTRAEPGPVRPRLVPPGAFLLPPAGAAVARVAADAPWQIAGSVSGTFSMYGLLISAGYEFSPANSALTFGIWYKQRGIQATLTQQLDKKTNQQQTILTIRLGDLSFGEILEYLIGLASPGSSRRLGTPWDVLYQVDFKNLSLKVNLTNNDVTVDYKIGLDLGFATFTSIGLRYTTVNGEGRVFLELTGQFLGQPFGGDAGEPLSWDVLNEESPAVPGKGASLLDLRYVGFGQHLALPVPVSQLTTVEKVLTALRADLKPVTTGGNPLTDPATAALRYDGNSNWLFGLDATILDTVTLSAVFFDPTLYGGVIALAGERAGGLAGLRFELLYRKITEDIGELSADLRVPDMFRHLEFGSVSVTLGLIHLDIYTNGNFRIDLGFPHNQDFSRSFGVEVFPFVGAGGFYFAYLTGATSQRVPQITNGTFSPVIEAGLGLSIGLGKNFQAGPLKAGLSIEVYGIFEGVFAPFNPYDRTSGTDNYYWIQGVAGIVGTLYGSVDFVVIKAEVSLVARAQVRFVLEAHRPSLVELKLSVTAKAKIKIIFITVHFSFAFTLEQSFVLGSASATPWLPGGNSPRLAGRGYLAAALARSAGELGASEDTDPEGLFSVPRLRQQRSQLPVRSLSRLRHARLELDSLLAEPGYRSLYQAELVSRQDRLPRLSGMPAEPPVAWPALPVFGAGNAKTARVQFVPMFTVADPASLYGRSPGQLGEPGSNQFEIVLGFLAENGTDPAVHGPAAMDRWTTEHVHHLSSDGAPALAVLVEAFLRWAAQAGAGKVRTDQISLLALEDLVTEVSDPTFQQATFGYSHLVDFLAMSLHFEVVGYPTGDPGPSDTSGTFVALPPDLTATVVSGESTVSRNYTDYQPVSTGYAANLAAYFQQLLTGTGRGRAAEPSAAVPGSPAPTVSTGTGPVPPLALSMAGLIFGEYCALLTQAALQAAIALLQNYPVDYPETGGPSLATLAGGFDGLSARVRLGSGQRLVDLAGYTGHHPDRLAAANPLAARGDSDQVDLPVEVTPLSIAEDNPAAVLATGLSIPMPPLPYQVRAGQSLDAIAAVVPFAASPVTGTAVGAANQRLAGLLRAGQDLTIPAFSYQPLAGDTRNLLTALMSVRNLGVNGIEHLDWYEQAISTLNPSVLDWSAPTGTVQVPRGYLDSTGVGYPVHPGDTLARIAGTQALYQAMDNSNDPVLSGPVTVPAMVHPIVAVDTFASLARDFPGLGPDALIAANTTATVLSPLAVLRLPAFTASIPADQTLAGLAAAYDLGLPDLVDIVADLDGLFAAGRLTIRDVPSRSVDQLVTDLTSTAQLNPIGTQLSNFVAHGLRAPAPDDTSFTDLTPKQVADGKFTGDLYGVIDLIGQQFSWPDATVPVQITLGQVASQWLSLVGAAAATGEAVSAELAALNPRLRSGDQPRPGLILATGTVDQLDLTVDQAGFGQYLPATTITLNASPPAALPDFRETPVHYNFQVTQHWQAAVRPVLPNGPTGAMPGEPSLWPLPANLQQRAGGPGSYRLATVPLTAPPDTEGTPLTGYCWAVNIGIAINRVANPNDPADTATPESGSPLGSPWLDGLYLVSGAAAEDSERLYQLWTYLAGGSDSAALYLLYPPNATSAAPLGYASDAVDAHNTVLLKTNLSTVTRDPGLGARNVPSANTYSASISDAADFLCLLWQASVVVAGGFYLRYDAGGAGLPDAMFDDTGQGNLQVLCLLTSQSGAAQPGGPLLAVNNVAVLAGNVDASAVQVYAERSDPGAPTTRVATVPPGTVGFEI